MPHGIKASLCELCQNDFVVSAIFEEMGGLAVDCTGGILPPSTIALSLGIDFSINSSFQSPEQTTN